MLPCLAFTAPDLIVAECALYNGSFSPIAGNVARLTAIEKHSRWNSEQFAWGIRREGATNRRSRNLDHYL
jgi:hypothetical protein